MSRGGGDWLLAQELFERGDPSFVDEVRRIDDADALGSFAGRWIGDPRPWARPFLFEYLDRPLNAYRHEALVKRLFKLAEAARDDELMARFLVLFDRSVRRGLGTRHRYESCIVEGSQEAAALAESWREAGYLSVNVWENWHTKKYTVSGRWTEPVIVTPRDSAMPRGRMKQTYGWDVKTRRYITFSVPDWVFALKLQPLEFRGQDRIPDAHRKGLGRRRLFSTPTRNYLRRRAWRYFRKLGRAHPDRYIAAVKRALVRYKDDDAADGLALIDNWSLIHILFHFSPCLAADERGWKIAAGRSLEELEPAPMFAKLWEASPRAFVDLLIEAQCRPVRGWAVRMIRGHLPAVVPVFTLEERLGLLGDDDPEVSRLAADLLRDDPALREVPAARWLEVAETASPATLDILCELIEQIVSPARVTVAQAVRLAMLRPLPLARLGFSWLQKKFPRGEEEYRALLGLVEAGSDVLRPELVRWARGVLAKADEFRPEWVLEWLDSRHADVRAEGWEWFRSEPRVHDDVTLWQRVLETPYDDLRLALIGDLEARSRGLDGSRVLRGDLDPELLRLLWASVLLNVHRGGRAKPAAVGQLLRRIEARPAELPRLLPLLAVALRSVRGPEWRSGLGAVVRLAGRDEATAALVRRAFPELQIA